MESIDIAKPLHLMERLFIFGGLWKTKKSWDTLQVFRFIIVTGVFCFGFCVSMAINLAQGEVMESLYTTLTMLSLLIRLINFMVKQQEFMSYAASLRSPLIAPKTKEEIELFRDKFSFFDKLGRSFMVNTFATLVAGGLYSILSGHKTLPFSAWYPFDWRNDNVHYWIAFTYQNLASSYSSAIHGIFDLAHGYLFLQISIFYRLISMRLQAVGHKRFRDGSLIDRSEAVEELKECIRMHQFVNKLSQSAQDIWTLTIAVQICVSGIVVCFAIFHITSLSPIENTSLFFFNFFFLGIMVIEIFLPCYYGNEVTCESELLSTAVYSSNWTEMNSEYKKLVICFMESLKKPRVLIAGGYFCIGLETMVKALQNAYSLFALLKSVKA